MKYNKEHIEKIKNHPELINSNGFLFEEVFLIETEINISGKVCKVKVSRNKEGNIEIEPIDNKIFCVDGWLENGHSTEGYNFDVIITQE